MSIANGKQLYKLWRLAKDIEDARYIRWPGAYNTSNPSHLRRSARHRTQSAGYILELELLGVA